MDKSRMLISELFSRSRPIYEIYKESKLRKIQEEKIELRKQYKNGGKSVQAAIMKQVRLLDSYYSLFEELESQGRLFESK